MNVTFSRARISSHMWKSWTPKSEIFRWTRGKKSYKNKRKKGEKAKDLFKKSRGYKRRNREESSSNVTIFTSGFLSKDTKKNKCVI